METIKFSKNVKLNKVLNSILDDCLKIHDTKKDSISEVLHYMDNFPKETDYNIYQYGNVLIYNENIRNLYKDYKSLQNVSDTKLIEIYKRQVGWIARYIKNNLQ